MICLGYSNAVKSDQLKWLPNGSELQMTTYDSSAKAKSYTSFSCSQDSMPEFSKKPLGVRFDDIILAKLGPGQVLFLSWMWPTVLVYKTFLLFIYTNYWYCTRNNMGSEMHSDSCASIR